MNKEYEPSNVEWSAELDRQIQATENSIVQFKIQERYYQQRIAKDKLAGKTDTMLALGRAQEGIREALKFYAFLLEWKEEVNKKLFGDTDSSGKPVKPV